MQSTLNERLKSYRDAGADGTGARPWTQREIAQQIGINEGAISQYIRGVYSGDVSGLEARIEDVLRNADRRRALADDEVVDTHVSVQISGVFESIRRSGDVGLVHSPAGLGKSCACRLYAVRNPSSILITVTRWNAAASGLTSSLWDAFETRRWRGNMSRACFIASRLAGSRRLLILDNAHRLTRGALEFLFDLYDDTGISIALVGNPEVLDKIKRSDQMFSRIGLVRSVGLGKSPAEAANPLVTRMVSKWCSDSSDTILDLATRVATSQGHFRSLQKHLALADDMRRALHLGWRDAIVEANKSLAVGYRL